MKIKLSHTVLSIFFLFKKIKKNKLFLWKCICYVKILNSVDNLYCTNHVIIPLWLFLLPIQQCCIKQWPRWFFQRGTSENKWIHTTMKQEVMKPAQECSLPHNYNTDFASADQQREKRTVIFHSKNYTAHVFLVDHMTWLTDKNQTFTVNSMSVVLTQFPFFSNCGFFFLFFLTLRY